MDLMLVATLLLGTIFVACILIARTREKKEFNNGLCKHCGNTLRHFTTDSQGGRGYICDKCRSTVWVSYKVDKNFKA